MSSAGSPDTPGLKNGWRKHALNEALGAARDHIAALSEEGARSQAGQIGSAVEHGVERLESGGKTFSVKLGGVDRLGDRVIGSDESYCCRGIARDGGTEAAKNFWREWGAQEFDFLQGQRPWERATATVKGTPNQS
jgi:hypothetical protein